MFVSKEIQEDVNKVLFGKWTTFDFLLIQLCHVIVTNLYISIVIT